MYYIYGLQEPDTQQLRYIGVTKNVKNRLAQHLLCKHKCKKTSWIKSLANRGLLPEIFVVEEIEKLCADDSEKFWISYFRYIGANLVNMTDGGGGVNGYVLPRDVRKRIGDKNRGRHHAVSARMKMSNTRKGVPREKFTAEWKDNIRVSRIGAKASLETKKKMPESHKRIWEERLAGLRKNPDHSKYIATLEHRQNISKGLMGRKVSDETRKKMSDARKRYCASRNQILKQKANKM